MLFSIYCPAEQNLMLHLPGDLFWIGLGELLVQQLSSGGDHRHQRETNTGEMQRNGPGDIRNDNTHVTGVITSSPKRTSTKKYKIWRALRYSSIWVVAKLPLSPNNSCDLDTPILLHTLTINKRYEIIMELIYSVQDIPLPT